MASTTTETTGVAAAEAAAQPARKRNAKPYFIVAGIEGTNVNYNCPTYTSSSNVFSFGVFNAAGVPQSIPLTVTARIDKSVVDMSGHPGASSWQICYASTTQFNALAGTGQQNVTIGGSPGYFTGLRPHRSPRRWSAG